MSEISSSTGEDFEGYTARILDIYPTDEAGIVRFTVDDTTTSDDLLATLAFLQPDRTKVDTSLDVLLEHLVTGGTMNPLGNRSVRVPDPAQNTISSDQIQIDRIITFGEQPSFLDLKQAFGAVFGDDEIIESQMRRFTLALVNSGIFVGTVVKVEMQNEITSTTSEEIESAMAWLTKKYYGEGELPSIE